MFDVLFLNNSSLFLLSLFSCLMILIIRHFFIKRLIFIFFYHLCFLMFMFVTVLGGGGVQNDGYERLEKIILLEKNNQLEDAKKNPQNYGMLQIDLQAFKNSIEFRDYLQEQDLSLDRRESICVGWFFALISEIAIAFTRLFAAILVKLRKVSSPKIS